MNDAELRTAIFDGLNTACQNGYRDYFEPMTDTEIAGDIIVYDDEIGSLYEKGGDLESRIVPFIKEWRVLDGALQALCRTT